MSNITEPQNQFGIEFQKGLIKLAMESDDFAVRLNQHLGVDVDLKDSVTFQDSALKFLFTVICNSVREYGTRPSPAQVIELIKEQDKDSKRLYEAYKNVMTTQVNDSHFHKERLVNFFRRRKIYKMAQSLEHNWAVGDDEKLYRIVLDFADRLAKVTMEKDDVFIPNQIVELIEEFQRQDNKPIATGIDELDKLLGGGLPRGELTGVVAIANAGKSLAALGIGANMVRQKLKVLHIPIEGTRVEAPFRYMANLSEIETQKLYKNNLTPAELEQLRKSGEFASEHLVVHRMLKFGVTIEQVAAVARDYYKKFKFDCLIVDYGRLLSSEKKHSNLRELIGTVHIGLSQLGKEFNCAVITPVQANRDAFRKRQEDQNRMSGSKKNKAVVGMEDIGEDISIAQTCGVILSINSTDEEFNNNQIRIHVPKQRNDKKGFTVGVYTRPEVSNLMTNRTFSVDDELSAEDVMTTSDQTKNIPGGALSSGDRRQIQLREAVGKAREVFKVADKIKIHKEKAETAGTPEAKNRHTEEYMKLEKRGKELKQQAITIGEKYFQDESPELLLPILKHQHREMNLKSSSFDVDAIEDVKLTINIAEWVISSRKKPAENN